MLQLKTAALDICRISKTLARYNIKANITNQQITLEGNIHEEMLTRLCCGIDIESVQNYTSEKTQVDVQEEVEFSKSEAVEEPKEAQKVIQDEIIEESIGQENVENSEESTLDIHAETIGEVKLAPKIKEYDLIYPVVKRGEVYWCDLNFDLEDDDGTDVYESEVHPKSKVRPVIIISNDKINMNEKCQFVNVVPCSTKANGYPWTYHFKFTK